MINGSCDFLESRLPPYVTTLRRLVAIDLAEEQILSFQFVTSPHVTRHQSLHGLVFLTFSHRTVNFGGYRSCGRGNITFLNCHMISCDHVIRRSFDFLCVPYVKSPPCRSCVNFFWKYRMICMNLCWHVTRFSKQMIIGSMRVSTLSEML